MSNVTDTSELIPDKLDRNIITAIMYNNFFTNDTALSLCFDSLSKLEVSRYWRNGVRRWANVTRQGMRDYSMRLQSMIGSKMIGFLSDLHDKFEEEIRLDVFKLKNACLLTLGRQEDAELIADVFLAGEFLLGACNNNDKCFQGYPHLLKYKHSFDWMRLTKPTKSYTKLSECFKQMVGFDYERKIIGNDVVFNGFSAVANKLKDAELILTLCNDFATEWEKENND